MGSSERPMAGGVEVIMLIQRISRGERGKAIWSWSSRKMRPNRRTMTSAKLPVRMWTTNLGD
jgi:hypothetical protein